MDKSKLLPWAGDRETYIKRNENYFLTCNFYLKIMSCLRLCLDFDKYEKAC